MAISDGDSTVIGGRLVVGGGWRVEGGVERGKRSAAGRIVLPNSWGCRAGAGRPIPHTELSYYLEHFC